MESGDAPSLAQRTVFGLLAIAAGLAPMLAAFDIGPLDRRDINGPPWLGFVAGGVFVVAGIGLWAGRLSPAASAALGLLLIGGLAAVANWIAFGAGERHCTGSTTLVFFSREHDLSGLGCRLPFGIGALIVNGMLAVVAVKTLQQALGGPPRLARLMRAAEWLMLASLAPILLPLLLLVVLRALGEALWIRMETGKWPRNEKFIARRRQRGQDEPPQACR